MVKCAKCGITFPNVKEWFLHTCNSIIHNHCNLQSTHFNQLGDYQKSQVDSKSSFNLTVDDLTSETSSYECLYCKEKLDGFGGFINHVCPNEPTLKYGNQ